MAEKLGNILAKKKAGLPVDVVELDCTGPLKAWVDGMKKTNLYKGDNTNLLGHKRNSWRHRLCVERLAISRLLHDIISIFLDTHLVQVALRLAHFYNESLKLAVMTPSVNVYCNTCPMMIYPLRKLNAPRLLQILAQKRAETSSYLLLDGLLMGYLPPGAELPPESPQNMPISPPREQDLKKQDSMSSDTSVEIFRALTEHLDGVHNEDGKEPMSCLEALLKMEEHRVSAFLGLTGKLAPQLLAAHCVKTSTNSGEPKVKKPVKKKLGEYYQDVLWGEVGGYLEHGLLWWSPDPLGSYAPSHAHHLKQYLSRLKYDDLIPESLIPATNSLLDALTCHTTSTSWDHLFRDALVAAAHLPGYRHTHHFSPEGTSTGLLFVALLADLVQLNNECENGCLTLEQLPLVEQIPVIHRLDHSVHTARLWAAGRCRQLAGTWNVAEFYCIAHTDITKSLDVLNKLEMANHGVIGPSTSVHVAVCAKMRGKLVSEVQANVDKLRGTLAECVDVLASGCRTQCLAHLHMSCPPPPYWRQSGPLPDCASDYVSNYLDCILKPVLLATDQLPLTVQISSTAMILRIVCESWLEYIYLHRYKFSEWGAVQLLTDFGAVPTWLMERVKLPKDLTPLLMHEVLRRCEGVGRLLLRRPGESIAMTAPLGQRSSGQEEKSADNMPAEMYVTNQEQWLKLRAPRTGNICCQL